MDGLRAIAVLAVLMLHADLGFPGSYVGGMFFSSSPVIIFSSITAAMRFAGPEVRMNWFLRDI
jgi:peptidoglycan/LPS O-acetylase OafA/YrhL